MAEENEHGLLPTVTDSGWRKLVTPLRSDISVRYVEKIHSALKVGLYDAAVTYTWDLVEEDLRLKVEAYGIDIFQSVEDNILYRESGETLQERWRDISSTKLLSGCFKLNIINRSAFRHLNFLLSVRHHESAAHPVDEEDEVDFDTAIFSIKDSIKFVLSKEPPQPGLNLRSFADNIKNRDISEDIDEVNAHITHLSTQHCNTALGMLISIYLGGSSVVKSNIQLIIKTIWDKASHSAKIKVGQKYAKFSAEGDKDSKSELFSLLSLVNGIVFIPDNLRAILFNKASKQLISIHFDWHNFVKEGIAARQLSELGVACPDDSLKILSEAIVISYIGNFYGESRYAQPYLRELLNNFTLRHWRAI